MATAWTIVVTLAWLSLLLLGLWLLVCGIRSGIRWLVEAWRAIPADEGTRDASSGLAPPLPPPSARHPHHHAWVLTGPDRVRCGLCGLETSALLARTMRRTTPRPDRLRQDEHPMARTLKG